MQSAAQAAQEQSIHSFSCNLLVLCQLISTEVSTTVDLFQKF